MRKMTIYLMLGLMLINTLMFVEPISYATQDLNTIKGIKLVDETGEEVNDGQIIKDNDEFNLIIETLLDESESSSNYIIPESLILEKNNIEGEVLLDEEAVGQYEISNHELNISTEATSEEKLVEIVVPVTVNEELKNEDDTLTVQLTEEKSVTIQFANQTEDEEVEVDSHENEGNESDEKIDSEANESVIEEIEATNDEVNKEKKKVVEQRKTASVMPLAENIELELIEQKEEYRISTEGLIGVETIRQTGKYNDVSNIYSKVDYDKVLDIHNNNLNSDHGITNADVKARIINQLGSNVKAVISYWVDADDTEYRQITFIENGQILQTADNTLAQHTFVGYDRSDEKVMVIKGVMVHLNHSGANIDINFRDPSNNKVQPGVLLDTPTKTKVNVKWVNGITGETVHEDAKFQELNKMVQTGSTINTNAHKAPEGFSFAGKLKQGESFIPIGDEGYTSPAIDINQIDLGVSSTSDQVEAGSDYHFLADYYIQNHLDVGESYTVNLQDYVYSDNTKPIGQSDMHKRQIDLTVKRINEEGDVELVLKDWHSGDEKKIEIEHGKSATYSNPNDFWHYYENNPGDKGWTVRTFHNDLKLFSPDDVVYVYYPSTTPKIDKDVEGKEHFDVDYEKDYNYNVITQLPIDIYDYEKFVVTDEVDEGLAVQGAKVTVDGEETNAVEVTIDGNLVTAKVVDFKALAGKGQIELVITAQIKADIDLSKYEDNKIPNTANLDFTNKSGVEDKIETEPVTVTPPPVETPDVEKEVEGNDGEYGKDLVEKEYEKEYNYRVNTKVPTNLGGYEHITLTDELDERLDVISAVALVDGEEVDYDVVIDGQLVTLKVERAQLNEIAGKQLTLQITAQIKADTPIEIIDNVAQIQVNDNPAEDSNVVPVTPPPTTPEIDKDVEGKEHLDIDYAKDYNYNVITKLPSNIEDYEKFVVTDKVDKGLAVQGAKVTVDGEETNAVEVTIDGNLVTAKVVDFKALAGKGQIELVITAQIKADTNISDYKDNKIPNTANLDFTNKSGVEDKIETEPVTVTPPPVETPDVEKEVEGNDGEYGKDLVEKEYEKEYNYRVNTKVPTNLGGYEHITLTDELDERLDVISAVALVDGEEVDYDVVIDGQLVTLKVERAQLNEIAGKQLTLQITAQIKADTPIEIIDNVAQIQVNDNPAEDSNVVPVTPPPTTPDIDKDVEGKDHLDVDYAKDYNYNVITKLPSNIEDYEKFVVTDRVDKGLAVQGATVTVDGEETAAVEVTIDGNLVTAKVVDFKALAGKGQIELVITAQIKADTNISDYKDNKIPNTADLDFTNENGVEDKIETEPVTVTPPPVETPDVDKEVEGNDGEYGTDLVEKEYEKSYNYRVNTEVPTNLAGYEHITLTDELDERLDVISAVALVDGEEVDYDVVIDGQLVTLKVERAQLNEIAGKQLTLQITAQIKADTPIEIIDNVAQIQVNDNPVEDSNVVPVTPPPTTPDIDKDVEGKDHLDVDYAKDYNYNVITKLPSNIEDYEKFVVTDKVDKGLEVKGAIVTVDGEETNAVEVTIDGNLVTAKVVDFKALAGKGQIELVITAQIKADTNISDYKDNKIPNTADLNFTNESGQKDKITTDPVTVTPPPTSDEPPINPEDPEDPEQPENPSNDDPGKKLPKTATNTYNILIIGLVMLLLGSIAFLFRKEKKEQ